MSSHHQALRPILVSKRALRVTLAVSLLAHFWVGPWRAWLGLVSFDDDKVHDAPLEIPTEISFEAETTAPLPAADAPADEVKAPEVVKKPKPVPRDAGAPAPDNDAGQPGDAGPLLATANDGGLPPGATQSSSPARGENEVDLIVNTAVVRAHPDGASVGKLLPHLPMWNLLNGTGIDPVRDFDALRAYGPSPWLSKAETLGVDIRYTTSDDIIDAAARVLALKLPPTAPPPPSTANVKLYAAKIMSSDVVVLRGKGHMLSIIKPPAQAVAFAAYLENNRRDIPVWANQALWLRVKDPHRHLPQFPAGTESLELRLETAPDNGGKLTVHVVGKTEQDARDLLDVFDTVAGSAYALKVAPEYPEFPPDLVSRRSAQFSGKELDVTIRLSAAEIHSIVQFAIGFYARPGH